MHGIIKNKKQIKPQKTQQKKKSKHGITGHYGLFLQQEGSSVFPRDFPTKLHA